MRNVLRKGRASPLTNPFLEDDLNKNWCIGVVEGLILIHYVFEKVISEADLSAVNLFTWKLFIGWVTDVLLVWLNLFSFYLWFCFLLQFLIFFFFWVVSKETENAHVQDSTSPLPFCALKFTRSLLTSLTLAFNSMANLFISLAFEWIMVKFHQGSHKVTLCFLFDWVYISYLKSSFGIFALHCIWGFLGMCLFRYELVRVQ